MKSPPARGADGDLLPRAKKVSVVAVSQLVIAPAATLDPQRDEDVLHRDVLLTQFHPIGRERRGLFAGERGAGRVVDQDSLVAAMRIVPHRVGTLRVAAL